MRKYAVKVPPWWPRFVGRFSLLKMCVCVYLNVCNCEVQDWQKSIPCSSPTPNSTPFGAGTHFECQTSVRNVSNLFKGTMNKSTWNNEFQHALGSSVLPSPSACLSTVQARCQLNLKELRYPNHPPTPTPSRSSCTNVASVFLLWGLHEPPQMR